MTTMTMITLSSEELDARLAGAFKSALLQLENRTGRSVLSVADVARDSGFSAETVRSWILKGRTAPGGRIVKLKIMDGLAETYRIRWEAYRAFLAEFPDIIC